MNKSKTKSNKLKISFLISFGFFLNQLLHTFVYWRGGTVSGFPNLVFNVNLSLCFSLIILGVSFLLIYLLLNWIKVKPYRIFFLFLFLQGVSQIFSIGLIKAGFEILIVTIIFWSLLIERNYPLDTKQNINSQVSSLIHSELSSLLRISISLFIFLFSVIGVSFAVQFLQKYYETQFFPRIIFWYGIMTIYVGVLFFIFIIYCLYRKIVNTRKVLTIQFKES